MKLAYCVRAIFPQHGYGGLERSATALVQHLLRRGVDIALFTRALPVGEPFKIQNPKSGRPLGHQKQEGHLTVHPVRYGRLPLRPNGIPARLTNYRAFVGEMGIRLERMSRKDYIDAVFAQGLCAWGVRRASEWGVPMVANPHGMEDFKVQDPLKRLAYAPFRTWVRAGCRAADRVVATDHSLRGEVADLLHIDPAKVVVIPNGVSIQEVHALVSDDVRVQLTSRWPTLGEESALKGISVGRLEANKGFEYLLRALAQAKQSLGERWIWVLVGDGSLRKSLEELSSELGLADRVYFAGQVSDAELHTLYSLSDLFVHPTLYEGSSIVTLESLAHGLPVVASAVGGIPDKVVDGETGFLVPPSQPEALAEKILWMAAHPEEGREMGKRGAALAEEKFSWEQIAAQTQDLFADLINEKSACQPIGALRRSC